MCILARGKNYIDRAIGSVKDNLCQSFLSLAAPSMSAVNTEKR